jgi:hypothetical protein
MGIMVVVMAAKQAHAGTRSGCSGQLPARLVGQSPVIVPGIRTVKRTIPIYQ